MNSYKQQLAEHDKQMEEELSNIKIEVEKQVRNQLFKIFEEKEYDSQEKI